MLHHAFGEIERVNLGKKIHVREIFTVTANKESAETYLWGPKWETLKMG